jgi:predicted enzyme related to lactoylglutathione lyase
VTFDVTSLPECQARLERFGAPCIQPPHDEGFGLVASFSDPEGNQFEIVELTYQFEGGLPE